MASMSNKDRLYDAGIIKPDRITTQEEDDAIESLTDAEVDSLISVNDKLSDEITGDNILFSFPGRSQPTQQK